MTSDRRQKIEEIFQIVAEAPPTARAALLAQHCGEDVELYREIEALLDDDETEDFLQRPVKGVAQALPQSDEYIGRKIGHYQVVKLLGQGGMGAVYLAERADAEYYRQVALKVVRRGMDSRFVLKRFRVERQILATLEHPNIAQLLDGGTTGDGLPYFVMEYVPGQPLSKYCESRKLSLTERLKLFLPVCAAVQHAHQKLIVHRDLKPSNILVTAEGVPKLLDFGIAKLLDPALLPASVTRTQTAMQLMTPEYASPEQVRGLPITAASDVYTLGVILFELLTGERPYQFDTYSPAEIERAVCETNVERPSAVAGRTTDATLKFRKQLAGDLDNIVLMALRKEPERRYQSVEQLAEDIRCYLDGRPISARRESAVYRANKFVRRHKAGVAAAALIFFSLLGGIIATARAARIARSERARAEAGLAEAQAQRAEAERQRRIAEQERAEALTQRERAETETIEADLQRQIAEAQRAEADAQRYNAETQQERAERRFAQVRKLANSFLFEFHDQIASLPGSTAAREMVVKTALEYLDSLAAEAENDPALLAELAAAYARIGDVQGLPGRANLGQSKAALENYAKAAGLSEKLLILDSGNEAVRRTLAGTYHSIGFLKMIGSAFAEAKQNALQSAAVAARLPLHKNTDPENFRLQARTHDLLSRLALLENNTDEALRQSRQMIAVQEQWAEQQPGARSQRSLATGYSSLATVLEWKGDLIQAETARRRTISLLEPLFNANPSDTQLRHDLQTYYNLFADLLANPARLNLCRTEEAVAYLHKALALVEELAVADAKNQTAQREVPAIYQDLGIFLREIDPAESVRMLKKAQELFAKLAAPGRSTGTDVFFRLNLAQSEWQAGDKQSARQNLRLVQQALRSKSTLSPGTSNHHFYLETGKLLLEMNEAEEALEYFRQSLPLIQKALSAPDADLLEQVYLADCYAGFGKYHALSAARADAPVAKQISAWQEARNWYQKSLAVWQDWPKKAPSSVFNQRRAAVAAQALADCEAALTGLAARQSR
ncbi:MAG TPA: serine/threonine-protein kinase [Blastocatellia bacterium]|nr:serine/threonine-protein kinase [Blastocatellia bacterium]